MTWAFVTSQAPYKKQTNKNTAPPKKQNKQKRKELGEKALRFI